MATNLRLTPEAEDAVRAEAARTGRSQQDVIRDAVDKHLSVGSGTGRDAPASQSPATRGVVNAPRSAYRLPRRRLMLGGSRTSADLLNRDDRV